MADRSKRVRLTAGGMILRGGYLNFRRAIRHAARYSAACELARPRRLLTLAEYQEATGMSRSQCFREQQAWRACCGDVTVLEAVSGAALEAKGWTEDQREEAIALWFARAS
jgi:hypothetical protein